MSSLDDRTPAEIAVIGDLLQKIQELEQDRDQWRKTSHVRLAACMMLLLNDTESAWVEDRTTLSMLFGLLRNNYTENQLFQRIEGLQIELDERRDFGGSIILKNLEENHDDNS